MKKFSWLIALIGSLVSAILVVTIYIGYLSLTPDNTANTAFVEETNGNDGIIALDPPQTIPDFRLTDARNKPITLNDLRGQPTLVTFGFTHCPDVCPITLGEYRKIYDELETNQDALNFVFVSVDGERDTPEVLSEYFETTRVADFVTGITGEPDMVRDFAWELGADFVYRQPDAVGNYNVDHTAGMFLLNENGEWIRRYSYGTPHPFIVSDIQKIFR